jgi:hypothetical protein
MSWLSKALGGNTLKIGAAVLGATVGKEYLFGQTGGGAYDTATGKFIPGKYTSGSFIAEGFNKLGIKPFSQTTVGSFLSPALNMVKDSGLLSVAGDVLSAQQRYGQMPTPTSVQAKGVNSAQLSPAGRAPQIPIGNNGAVNRALQNPQIRHYLAKRAQMIGMPSLQTVRPTVSSSASLASTTSGKRRVRSKLIGG